MTAMNNVILHQKEIMLNKENLRSILKDRKMTYLKLYEKSVEVYGLDLTYKGFMSLLDNRSSWKFLYAHAIIDVLDLKTYDIFDIVEIDIDKKIEEKKAWREKYQN